MPNLNGIQNRKTFSAVFIPTGPQQKKSPLSAADSYFEKGVVGTLMALDTASHISPFRWLFYLAGCGGQAEERDAGETYGGETAAEQTACLKDVDCRSPRICEGGLCLYPPPSPADESATPDAATIPAADTEASRPEDCKPQDTRLCGPCDVGVQECGDDHLWKAACEYLPSQLEHPCYTGPAATKDKGVCREGTQSCNGYQWGDCEGEILPTAETCDNLDNDCDGVTDGAVCEQNEPIEQGEQNEQTEQTEQAEQGEQSAPGRKIGDPCAVNLDCDSNSCIPPTEFPGGYCTDSIEKYDYYYAFQRARECLPATDFRRAVCVEQSEFRLSIPDFICVALCIDDADCRIDEGYLCKPIVDSALTACLPRHNEVIAAVYPDGRIPACSH
ncbi:MAG: hypothetical protein Q8P84_05060 [Deltaproteobacteria bacterium]|nr:hypothetical protein [Deltaproteobacteria bacterium]